MATTVTMPQLGETVTEGTILKWAKEVGDTIAEDEVLVEISTDKVDTEVPSPAAGTILEILVAEGDTVGVGTPLVVIEGAGEVSAEEAVVPPTEAPVPPTEAPVSPPGSEATLGGVSPEEGRGASETPEQTKPSTTEVEAFFAEPDVTESKPHLLSPVVRKLIRENEIDVSLLTGTGQGGRITRKDVDAFLVSTPAVSKPAPAAAPAPAMPAPAAAATAPAPAAQEGAPPETIELDRMRIRIAENMIKAKQSTAHVWTSVEVDFERIERLRQARKVQFKANEGFSLTYLPFISRATIDALKAFPRGEQLFQPGGEDRHLPQEGRLGHRHRPESGGSGGGQSAQRRRPASRGYRPTGEGARREGPGWKTEPRRPNRFDFYDHQSRTVRVVHVGADHQHSQRCDPLNRHGGQTPHGDHNFRRPGHDRYSAHRLFGTLMGPPCSGWVDGGPVLEPDQGEPGDLGLGARACLSSLRSAAKLGTWPLGTE